MVESRWIELEEDLATSLWDCLRFYELIQGEPSFLIGY